MNFECCKIIPISTFCFIWVEYLDRVLEIKMWRESGTLYSKISMKLLLVSSQLCVEKSPCCKVGIRNLSVPFFNLGLYLQVLFPSPIFRRVDEVRIFFFSSSSAHLALDSGPLPDQCTFFSVLFSSGFSLLLLS